MRTLPPNVMNIAPVAFLGILSPKNRNIIPAVKNTVVLMNTRFDAMDVNLSDSKNVKKCNANTIPLTAHIPALLRSMVPRFFLNLANITRGMVRITENNIL